MLLSPVTRGPLRARHTLQRLQAICLGIVVVLALTLVTSVPRTTYARDLAVDLSMHYIHQYLGNSSDDFDCGPASLAMVLEAYHVQPAGTSDARFVAAVRRSTGAALSQGTYYADLARAVGTFGLSYSFVPSGLPGEPAAEAGMMSDAINAGNLVIAMVHGATLGRGTPYGDHWLVVAGFNGDTVHVLDPDDQTPRTSDWLRGGDITIPLSLLESAGLRAQPGPYAMIIYPPGRQVPLGVGSQARISGTDGDGAFLRSSPGIADNKLDLLAEGTLVTVQGPLPAANADGHDWIGVWVNGQQGYVAADYVAPADQSAGGG